MHSDNLLVLIDERNGMRIAIQEIEKAQHRIVGAIITLIAGSIGIIFGGSRILEDSNLAVVVFLLSQVLFLLVIFNFQLTRNMAIKSIYCSVLEEEINRLIHQDIASFSKVCSRYLYSPRCIAFWVAVIFALIGLSSFVLMYLYLFANFPARSDRLIFSVIFGLEFILIVSFFIFSFFEDKSADSLSRKIVRLPRIS